MKFPWPLSLNALVGRAGMWSVQTYCRYSHRTTANNLTNGISQSIHSITLFVQISTQEHSQPTHRWDQSIPPVNYTTCVLCTTYLLRHMECILSVYTETIARVIVYCMKGQHLLLSLHWIFKGHIEVLVKFITIVQRCKGSFTY